jgi:hypothetical protein
VGAHGTLVQWNGSAWVADPGPASGVLYAIAAPAGGPLWAVGDSGQPLQGQ